MTAAPGSGVRQAWSWRVIVLLTTMVAIFLFDVLVPPVVVLPFLCVPVVIAALWERPTTVALLATLSVLMAIVSGQLNDYFGTLNNVLWMSAMVTVGVVAVIVAESRTRAQAERESAVLRLQATLDSMIDPHAMVEAIHDAGGVVVDFVIVEANRAAIQYVSQFNRTIGDGLVGLHPLAMLSSDEAGPLLDYYRRLLESGEPLVQDDVQYPAPLQPEDRYYDIRVVSVGGSLSYTWRDVTERHNAAQRLAESEERYRLLAENSSDVVMRSRDNMVVWVSPSLTPALGWDPDDWIGHSLAEFGNAEDHAAVMAVQEQVRHGESARYRVRFADITGTWHWVDAHSHVYRDSHGDPDGYLTSFRIADTEVEAQRLLEIRATYDDLTGAIKRDIALTRLQDLGQHPRNPGNETAVLFLDVDSFKNVNDTHGHSTGDALLKHYASVMRESVRAEDTVARLGGDEFLVILAGMHSVEEAVAVAEKIRARCAEPVTMNEGSVTATVSVGVTLNNPIETGDAMIERADRAMYQAKAAGGNRVVALVAEAQVE